MKIGTRYAAALAAPILLWGATAFGQRRPPTPRPVRRDATDGGRSGRQDRPESGASHDPDGHGTIHEFTASAETLQDLKEGDRIEARLRR